MYRHPIRKAIIIFFIYSVFIIGIFFLQFRSESVLNRSFGALRVSVDQSVTPEGKTVLKNKFKASFPGIVFSTDESTPAVLKTDTKETLLTLESFEENEKGCIFKFNNDVALTFEVFNDEITSSGRLLVTANIPENSSLRLNYKPASSFSVTEKDLDRLLFSSKGKEFNLTAGDFEKNKIIFSKGKNIATFSPVISVNRFYLASINNNGADYPLSEAAVYEKIVSMFKSALVNHVQNGLSSSSTLLESTLVSYVAEMGSRGSYKAAVDSVPDSWKRSQRRTFFSSPFFNSLVSMEPTLRRQNENLDSILNSSIMENSLSAFTASNFLDYALINSKKLNVLSQFRLPANMEKFEPTTVQAYSILDIYAELKKQSNPLSENLTPVLDTCIEKIEKSCILEDEKLRIVDNGTPLSVVQSVGAGTAVLNYAAVSGRSDLIAGARLIVASALNGSIPSDLHELGEIYPLLERNNTFYPHVKILSLQENTTIWAWTSAESIDYKFDAAENSATIRIKFPVGETHYLIIKGIQPFSAIDIYGVAYRSDSRFESYNSSGYIYNSELKTLFLKSRHKSETEEIKLYFSGRPQQQAKAPDTKTTKPAEPTPLPSTSANSDE